jgi:hypothetical protein
MKNKEKIIKEKSGEIDFKAGILIPLRTYRPPLVFILLIQEWTGKSAPLLPSPYRSDRHRVTGRKWALPFVRSADMEGS